MLKTRPSLTCRKFQWRLDPVYMEVGYFEATLSVLIKSVIWVSAGLPTIHPERHNAPTSECSMSAAYSAMWNNAPVRPSGSYWGGAEG